ncbi:MAG: hypothetical protein MJ200_04050 [Mycoplasmoidaceae bacterium]|nr:hypothetical protein [Mycoplasmoidaceae bacterium]
MQQLDNCKDINDILDLMKDNIKIVNYSMLNTSKDGVDSEHNQLKNTYFNAAANNGASIKLYFKDKDA